jgi:hypothetical protein
MMNDEAGALHEVRRIAHRLAFRSWIIASFNTWPINIAVDTLANPQVTFAGVLPNHP